MITIRVSRVDLRPLQNLISATAYRAVEAGLIVAREAHEEIVANWVNQPSITHDVELDPSGAQGKVVIEDTATSWWHAANFGASTLPKGGPAVARNGKPMPIRPYTPKTSPGSHGGPGQYSSPSRFANVVYGPRIIEPRDFINTVLDEKLDAIIEAVRAEF